MFLLPEHQEKEGENKTAQVCEMRHIVSRIIGQPQQKFYAGKYEYEPLGLQ
jgi:hypothetical protein